MRNLLNHGINIGLTGAILLVLSVGCYLPFRLYNTFATGYDAQQNWRYLIETGETVEAIPSEQAFSSDYLRAVFGDNPELLEKLRKVVTSGLSDPSKLQLRTVSAMLVTHRTDENGGIIDVATHIIGGFQDEARVPGFHRDGYFKHLLDRDLWNFGNSILSFLGRDMVIYSDKNIQSFQEELIESFFTGEVEPLVKALDKPYSYTLVIPNPRRMLPPQLRQHVQTIVLKGTLSQMEGTTEFVALCSSDESAAYTGRVLDDMCLAAVGILRSKFGGLVEEKAWGHEISSWWAYELVVAAESAAMTQDENILRLGSNYNRVMVNVILKSIQRLGRDLRQIRGTMEEKKDPRLVDAEMATRKGSHYWSEAHRWGPNWPIHVEDDWFDENPEFKKQKEPITETPVDGSFAPSGETNPADTSPAAATP